MGDHNTPSSFDEQRHQDFLRALLDDVKALEMMIEGGLIETGVRRIGAEQEVFLVDGAGHPAPIGMEVLARINDPEFTTELARFNLETNLPPSDFGGDCLRRMEQDIEERIARLRKAAAAERGDVFLAGILPTLQLSDLTLDNMAPVPRYAMLNAALVKLRAGDFQVRIKGIFMFLHLPQMQMMDVGDAFHTGDFGQHFLGIDFDRAAEHQDMNCAADF